MADVVVRAAALGYRVVVVDFVGYDFSIAALVTVDVYVLARVPSFVLLCRCCITQVVLCLFARVDVPLFVFALLHLFVWCCCCSSFFLVLALTAIHYWSVI